MSVARVQEARPFIPTAPLPVSDIVKKIALTCLKELAVALTLAGVVASFVATPMGLTFLVSAALIQFGVSVFFHSVGAYASAKAAQKGPHTPHFQRIISICEWITGANFALFSGYNAQTLLHETGHALAALALYKNPRPQIGIYPFFGGLTQFYKTTLSPLGKKIGPVATTFLVVASGPGFTILISAILFAIGLAIKEKYPQFGKHLMAWGLLDFFHHADYAYSALSVETTNLAHDFVHLSIFGLHPVTATVGILAIPIVISLGMHLYKNRQPRQPQLALSPV